MTKVGKLEKFEKQGFTFLEILIAAVILSAGGIVLTKTISTGMWSSGQMEEMNQGLNVAKAKMEELKATNFTDLQDSGPSSDSDFSYLTVKVKVSKGQNPMPIQVTVSWEEGKKESSVILTTLRASY